MFTDSATSTFGSRLAEKRKAAGLTQEQLGVGMAADGGDIGKGGVSSWEVGRTLPSAHQIARICERLKCSADDLLGLKTKKAQKERTHG
jgi:transcriptional regulator with XRE-family HTH domain